MRNIYEGHDILTSNFQSTFENRESECLGGITPQLPYSAIQCTVTIWRIVVMCIVHGVYYSSTLWPYMANEFSYKLVAVV